MPTLPILPFFPWVQVFTIFPVAGNALRTRVPLTSLSIAVSQGLRGGLIRLAVPVKLAI